jgi:hypothetical protein
MPTPVVCHDRLNLTCHGIQLTVAYNRPWHTTDHGIQPVECPGQLNSMVGFRDRLYAWSVRVYAMVGFHHRFYGHFHQWPVE